MPNIDPLGQNVFSFEFWTQFFSSSSSTNSMSIKRTFFRHFTLIHYSSLAIRFVSEPKTYNGLPVLTPSRIRQWEYCSYHDGQETSILKDRCSIGSSTPIRKIWHLSRPRDRVEVLWPDDNKYCPETVTSEKCWVLWVRSRLERCGIG